MKTVQTRFEILEALKQIDPATFKQVLQELLEKHPEILRDIFSSHTITQHFATKDDFKLLLEFLKDRFNDVNQRFEEIIHFAEKRFEDMNRRFEDMRQFSEQRFEEINQRFADIKHYTDKRFEEFKYYTDKRFEEVKYYMDKRFEEVNQRFSFLTKLILGFNVPIILSLFVILLKLIFY